MKKRVIALGVGSVGLCFLLGCFKSSTTQASFEGSSKSSAAPFKSSSDSSGSSDKRQAAYHRDVRDYTARFAAAPGDVRVFQRDLSAIAESHGVTDWEHDDVTYFAIGQGLARAGLEGDRFRRLAKELASKRDLAMVKAGYEQYPKQ